MQKKSGVGKTTMALIFFTSTAVAIISVYTVVILVFGLLPGIIAGIVDYNPKQYLAKIVTSFNVIGVVPYVVYILNSSVANETAMKLITSAKTWLIIYSAAGIGWIIHWLFPQVAFVLMPIRSQKKIESLNKELDDLAQEWGEDIKGVSNISTPHR